jgi:hypothetical protein
MTKPSPEQIITKLRAAEVDLAAGLTTGQVCQKPAISEQTWHRWRAQDGGLTADIVKRLKELEVENGRLKRLVAQLALDKPPAPGHQRTRVERSGAACGAAPAQKSSGYEPTAQAPRSTEHALHLGRAS